MDADGVSQGVSEAERSLGGLKTAMGAAGVAAGALAAGGLAASVQAASQLQTEMTELEKVAGAETMRAMKSEIREMSKTIPLAQTELTQLTSDAARFGIRGPENLRSFTESVAKLSTATDLAATEAGESMAKLAQLTGTPIPKVENLGSSINSVSNTAATSSSEIVDSMLRSAGALSQMGLTQTEIVGLSGTLNEVSESSERAGTRLRRLSQELTNPKKVDNLSAALGLTSDEFKNMRSNAPVKLIQQMATEMKQGGDAADLLRKNLSTTSRQALSALGQNLEGLNKNLKTSRTEFKKNTSLQKEFNAASDTFNNKVQLLKNSIMALAVSVGNNLLPYLSPLVERLSRLVTRFTAWSESMGGLPATIGLVATAITGLVGGGALLASQLGIAASASTALGAALGVLTGPIGLVVLAVAGLAAAFATNFGGIRDQTMRVVSVLQAELQPAIEWLRSDGVSIFNQIKSAVGAFVTFVEPYFAKVISLIADGLIVYIRTLATVWSAVFNTIETVVTTVWNSVLRPFITWLTSFWGNQNGQLMADISETWTVIQNTISDFVVWARPYIRSFATWVVARWRQMWQIVEPLFDAHLSNIVAIVKFGLGSIRRGIEFFADGIITTFRAFLAVIRGDWSEAWELMTGLFHRQVDRILSQARAFGKTIVTVFTNIGKGIIGVFRNLYQTLIGNSLIPDMFNDIVSYIKTTAKQRISGAIDQVIGSVKSAFSYMTGTGAGTLYGDVTGTLSSISSKAENWVSDFTQPFEDAKNDVERKFSNLKETLIGNSIVPDMLDDMVTEGEGWVGNFTSPFQDAKERVLSEFGKMKDGATDAASGIGETINEIAKKHGEFDDHAKKEVFSSLGNSDLKKLASSLTNLDYSHKKYESNPVRGNFGKAMSMLRETKRKGYTGTQFDNLLARSGDSGVYDLLERLHDFPHLDTGGKILKEGLYRGHPGERVLNPAETKRVDRGQHPDGGSGETYVTIDLGSLPEDAWVQADALADMALAKFDKRDERESRRL